MQINNNSLISHLHVTPENILQCKTIDELAIFFGFSDYLELSKLIYPKINKQYYSFKIKKKSGGFREIKAPKKKLKELQLQILSQLEKIYKVRKGAHGFIENKSIVTNASLHVGKNIVFNLDLQDFFSNDKFRACKKTFHVISIKSNERYCYSSRANMLCKWLSSARFAHLTNYIKYDML